MRNKVQEQYFREIRGFLSYDAKKRCIAGLQDSVSSFIEKNPDATLNDLHAAFGEPQAVAESYLKRENHPKQATKYKLIIVVAIACIVLLIVLSVVLIADMIDFRRYISSFSSGYHTYIPTLFTSR